MKDKLRKVWNTIYDNLTFIGGTCLVYWFVFWFLPNWAWDNKWAIWEGFKGLSTALVLMWIYFRLFGKGDK